MSRSYAVIQISCLHQCLFITGEAVKMILEKKFGEDWAKKLKIIYAGDDTTDEDAMKVKTAILA